MLKKLLRSALITIFGLAVLGMFYALTSWFSGLTSVDYLLACIALCAVGAADFFVERKDKDEITLREALERSILITICGGFVLGLIYAFMENFGWNTLCYLMVLITVAVVGAGDFFFWWLPEKYGGDE
jgi:amino acid transporter